MILTILETLPVVVVSMLLGAWVKSLYDTMQAEIKRTRGRMEAMRAAQAEREREYAEPYEHELVERFMERIRAERERKLAERKQVA